jgi:hypothetical protein
MRKEAIKSELGREPFVPLRLHMKDGTTFDVRFREMVYPMRDELLAFIGMKQGTRQAKRLAHYVYDDILRIERLSGNRGHRRRKAS